jgi:hypothetical protein
METPVIYFYSPQPLVASVHVDLPTGLITEWYPQANRVSQLQPGMTYGNQGNIEWPSVQVSPGAPGEFPTAGDHSHYYAARETDSAPLRVGDQNEKLLFYRGIADFDIPLQPRSFSDGRLEIRNAGEDAVAFAILFENRDGKTGYRVIRDLRGSVSLDPPELTAAVASVHQELAGALIASGLYPKEAAAMIETWRDSWFEEGMRIFYVVPRKTVDAVLPLKIAPAPAAVERVFVGRVEVFSPAVQRSLATALESGDIKTLRKYGRFLRPFCDRLKNQRSQVRFSREASDFLARSVLPAAQPGPSPCRVDPSPLPTEQQ